MTLKRRSSSAGPSLLAALLAAGPLPTAAPAPAARAASATPAGVAAWLEGDAAQAILDLATRTDREGVLNRAVARLYAGDAAAAEGELAALHAEGAPLDARRCGGSPGRKRRRPARSWRTRSGLFWPPARPTAATSSGSADGGWKRAMPSRRARACARRWPARRTSTWAGCGSAMRRGPWATPRRRARRGSVRAPCTRAATSFSGSARAASARDARPKAGSGSRRRSPPRKDAVARRRSGAFSPGSLLRPRPGTSRPRSARASGSSTPPAISSSASPPSRSRTRASRRSTAAAWPGSVFSMRSNPGFPLLTIDSRFESFIAEDGSVLAHRSSSRDSTQARRAAAYDMDPATGQCVVRQVVEGLFGFDRFPLAPLGQDGVSVLQLARGLSRSPARVSVLTAVDSTWKGTELRTVAAERIRWAGREVEAFRSKRSATTRDRRGCPASCAPGSRATRAPSPTRPRSRSRSARWCSTSATTRRRRPTDGRAAMTLSEPTTLASNWVLAAVAVALAAPAPPRRARRRPRRLWAAAFLAGATAALAGGAVHGFAASLSPPGSRRAVEGRPRRRRARGQPASSPEPCSPPSTARGGRSLLAGAAGQLAVYLGLVSGSDDVRLAVGNGAVTIVALLALVVATATHDGRRLVWILLALGLSAAGLAAQRAGLTAAVPQPQRRLPPAPDRGPVAVLSSRPAPPGARPLQGSRMSDLLVRRAALEML